jgi:uncharacterized repeat protein (TIGR01451 family)
MTYVSSNNGVLVFSLGNLAMPYTNASGGNVYSSTNVTLVVIPGSTNVITNTAVVYCSSDTKITNDNVVVVTNTVSEASADLVATLSGSPNPVIVGGTVTFAVTVSNKGPSVAASTVLTNILPAGAVLVNPASGWNTNAGTYSLGNLKVGVQTNFTFDVRFMVVGDNTEQILVGSSLPGGKAYNHPSCKIQVDPMSVAAARNGASISLTWPGNNTNYVVEMTTNLVSPNWVVVTNAAPVSGQLVVPVSYTNTAVFYRVRTQ